MAVTILMIAATERLRMLAREYLAQEGYEVVTASDARQGLSMVHQLRPDLLVLDRAALPPELDLTPLVVGVPVVLIADSLAAVQPGLAAGAASADILVEPFAMRALSARLRVALRRCGRRPPASPPARVGDLVLDRGSRRVQVAGRPVSLTPSEFDLLATLMSAPGHAFSRPALLDLLQGVGGPGHLRTVDVHIRNLRAKIEPDPGQPRAIETVYGYGYRLAAPT